MLNVFQLTPTAYLTPDVELIRDPPNNADLGSGMVFRLPLVTYW